jgi:predicted nucleic acid-binding protein
MTVLIDTNVALDWMLQREPFFENAQLVINAVEKGEIFGLISASAITDIYFLSKRELKNNAKARVVLRKLLNIIKVSAVDENTIYNAFNLEWPDFEDAVQYAVAENIDADYIVTRNTKDFATSEIQAITPSDLLDIIAPEED